MRIVLASSSPYRKKQLATLGIVFDCISPGIDESPIANEPADTLSLRLASGKAQSVATKIQEPALVIGSDQTVCCEGQLLGKPGDYPNAVKQLEWLGGKEAVFYSALALLDTRCGTIQRHITKTVVTYRKLNHHQITRYLQADQPFDCAGSFKCESLGIAILASVSSNDPSALIGLPLIALTRMLTLAGVDLLA